MTGTAQAPGRPRSRQSEERLAAAIAHATFRLGPAEVISITRAADAILGDYKFAAVLVNSTIVQKHLFDHPELYKIVDGGWTWVSPTVPPNPAAQEPQGVHHGQ